MPGFATKRGALRRCAGFFGEARPIFLKSARHYEDASAPFRKARRFGESAGGTVSPPAPR
jgi:hypothetical protein